MKSICRNRAAYLLLLFFLVTVNPSCSGRNSRPSVLLIIIDTLRADHLTCYGYERVTSPSIDSLAASGTVMLNACAQASWTLPASASIVSGLSSRAHGAGMNIPTGDVYGLDPEMPLLSYIMNMHGYSTAGFFNVYLLGADFGFHRGFDVFSCRENGDGMARETVDSVIVWLEGLSGENPFFLMVHLFDVHDPYDPPEPFDRYFSPDGSGGDVFWKFTQEGAVVNPEMLDHLMALYDGEIAYVDHELGRLFTSLRETGLSGNTLVILTADHGEEFLEHGYVGHGRTFFPEITHIPLIIAGPGIEAGTSESAICGQFDILPTILDFCDIPLPERQDGISLFGNHLQENRFVPSSGVNTGEDFSQVMLRDADTMLIWNAETDEAEIYQLREDPFAHIPLQPESGIVDRALYYWSTPCLWDPVLLDEWRVAPVLRDLGYIE